MRPIYATQKLPEYQQYCKKLCLVGSLLKWPALFDLPFVLFYAVIIPETRTQPNFAQSNLFTCSFPQSNQSNPIKSNLFARTAQNDLPDQSANEL